MSRDDDLHPGAQADHRHVRGYAKRARPDFQVSVDRVPDGDLASEAERPGIRIRREERRRHPGLLAPTEGIAQCGVRRGHVGRLHPARPILPICHDSERAVQSAIGGDEPDVTAERAKVTHVGLEFPALVGTKVLQAASGDQVGPDPEAAAGTALDKEPLRVGGLDDPRRLRAERARDRRAHVVRPLWGV